MGEAIGSALPLAVGVALSPIPIIAVVLMLTTQRARSNGPAFVLGWLIGLFIVGAIVLLAAGSANASASGEPATWVSWLKLVLGILLLVLAVREFRGRPAPGEEAALPKWMSIIDRFRPVAAVGLAAALAGVNPKNLLLAIGGAAAIAQTGIPGGQQAVAYVVFALIGTLGVGLPIAIYLSLGERSEQLLARLKGWMAHNNAVIMAVLCLIIGVKLVGDALGGLL